MSPEEMIPRWREWDYCGFGGGVWEFALSESECIAELKAALKAAERRGWIAGRDAVVAEAATLGQRVADQFCRLMPQRENSQEDLAALVDRMAFDALKAAREEGRREGIEEAAKEVLRRIEAISEIERSVVPGDIDDAMDLAQRAFELEACKEAIRALAAKEEQHGS